MAREVPHPFPTTAEGQLSLVLWLVWDAAGGQPDEYRSYAPQILGLLRAGAAHGEIAAALSRLRIDVIGGEPELYLDRRAAWSIQDWYDRFLDYDEAPLDSDGAAPPTFGADPEPWLPG